MTQMSKIARWDKLKSWKDVTEEIDEILSSSDKFDNGMTLEIGPQLLHTLRHPSALRSVDHALTKFGDLFTCNYNKGAVQGMKMWLYESKGKDSKVKHKSFETDCEITCITFLSKHRVYLTFCTDLTMRVFTDARSNFVEVDCLPCLSTTLCLIHNKDEDEVYAGGIGVIEEWKIHGSEHAASLVPGRIFHTDLTRNDWIRDIKVVKQNNHIIAQHGDGLCVIHYKTRKQLHRLPNRHAGPLTCCCYYPQSDFLITGGSDGNIRIFNGTAFNLLHVLVGHHKTVTAMEAHGSDALLFTCSHDGTIRIWRMDSLRMFCRLDLGEKIYHLSLISDAEFFFYTEKSIMLYNCNQFYEFFAPVESETKRLMCCRGKDRPNRILASTEDGSVRLFSPITGLTLTIMYPMPSFQVLMSFAYDLHQDKLHTVLTGGRVLVYNTATNPCKAEEIWMPKREDEHVNILILVTVEFPCEEGTDLDNLVFAGLKNGQIILCDAVVCTLEAPIQAHEGEVTLLESCLHQASVPQRGGDGIASMVVSGGTDKYVKVWKILINTEERRPVVELCLLLKVYAASIPVHITMCGSNLWICTKTETKLGIRWKLILHKLVQIASSKTDVSQKQKLLHGKYILMSRKITHPEDEDHTMELTSIDKCPSINLVMTSGKDGLVKIWSSDNELIRELSFASPIYASCFANDRGDILVGFGAHICSISVVNYLPVDYLKKVLSIAKFCEKDDIRELPVKFDNKSEPWLDLSKVSTYSVDIILRRRQRLEEEVIERFKQAKEKSSGAKFIIFVDGKTTKVVRKDFADKLLNWARGKNKFKFKVKTAEVHTLLADTRSDTENKPTVKESINEKDDISATVSGKTASSVKKGKKAFFDSGGLLEIYPSTVGKALKQLNQHKHLLGPEGMRLLQEQELLKKDPIIAPDGYIPNSVIRSKLKLPKVDDSLRRAAERPFQLKPVPKVNPQHMPSWWETEEDKEKTSTRLEYRVMKWDDTPSPPPKSEISSVSSVSLKSLIESPVKKYIAEGRSKTTTPRSPKSKSEQKSGMRSVSKSRTDTAPIDNVKQMIKANNKNVNAKKSGWEENWQSEKADSDLSQGTSKHTAFVSDRRRASSDVSDTLASKLNKGKPGTPSGYKLKSKRYERGDGTPDSARRGRPTGVREKSLKLTDYAVDEDSSAIHTMESKSGRRLKSHMSHVIIKQLLEEDWMPDMDSDFDYGDVIDNLVNVLDDQDDSAVYDSACTYVVDLFHDLGLSEDQLDQLVGKLGTNLDNINTDIRRYSIRTLQEVGKGRNDVLVMILPKLMDADEPIRRAAVEAIRALTGAYDKETLLNVLEVAGITSATYRSKPDEDYTLAMLAEKFGEHEDPELYDRIQNWVEGTTPGLFDEREGDEGMWQDGSRSRKEYSFMSEGRSVIDTYDTSGRNTMYADIPTTPGSLSDNDELIFSRGVSMHTTKSGGVKSEKSRYNARMDLLDRAGASILPGERLEQPTPLSDLVNNDMNDVFLLDDTQSPFMQDPLLGLDQDGLIKERSDLSRGTAKGSQKSLENLLLKERTLTDLSQIGPLPNFMPRDNTGRNFDELSTDSAFESAISVSEYDTSHFSEKWTMSHTDQHSSKHSLVSDENNMFDVEQVSNLEFEGDDAESGIEINSMNKHDESMKNDVAFNMDKIYVNDSMQNDGDNIEKFYINDNEGLGDLEKSNSMESSESDELESGKISVMITPRGTTLSRETPSSKTPLTPRSKAAGSNFKRRMKETDGFSTISDRSSSSRKSRRSGRDGSHSGIQSRSSSGNGLPLPYTLPNNAKEAMLLRTASGRSQIKYSLKLTQRDILEESKESLEEVTKAKSKETTKMSEKMAEADVKIDENVKPVFEKAKTVNTEHTSVSVDTVTGSVETQMVSKGTPANTPEAPANMNGAISPSLIALGALENQRMDPIAEVKETPSFLKTPQVLEGGVPMESTKLDKAGLVTTEHGVGKLPRLINDQGSSPSDQTSLDIRFTPKDPRLYKYYDGQKDGQSEKPYLKEGEPGVALGTDQISTKDSDYQTISNISSSQITDRLSGYDSGIAKEMSEFSHGHAHMRGYPHAPLSPVKSESASPAPHSTQLHSPKDWRKFFDLVPNAQERKQMEQIRREMEQGKLRHTTLPPISYFAEDLPMLPGEAGTRLLQTVRVGEKMQVPGDGRHRIESVPGKLAVHTQNEAAGLSNFGILQMQWTTGVPTARDRLHPPQRIPQHRSHKMIRLEEAELHSAGLNRIRNGLSDEELNLPYFNTASPVISNRYSPNQYEWEFPLPPPPAKESRTEIPHLRRDHENYCKYYNLVKKKLHLYTSQQKEKTKHLPELFVKRLRDQSNQVDETHGKSPKMKRSATKSSTLFPPIKIGHLVKIY